ncbi:MAG: helix-turn-helix transcriptional regulator, partial [Ktedonobacteraceae bacterium]
MKQGGRPRRSEERPDSAFGEVLKEYVRRVKDFTQAELARESIIPEKTLSQMVKGKRTRGTTLRRDLRAIIKVLHQKKALFTLEEANRLITRIPTVKELDERDPEDAEIIALFETPATESVQAAGQSHDEAPASDIRVFADNQDESVASDAIAESLAFFDIPLTESVAVAGQSHDDAPSDSQDKRAVSDARAEPVMTPLPMLPSPMSETAERPEREPQKRLWWYAGAGLALVVVLGMVLVLTQSIFSGQADSCSAHTNGITLYTDINYQGHCATFGPGEYELARFGLEQNVSSIKDPNHAYHITLFDKAKNLYHLDADMPVFPAEWDNRADTMHVEKNRPTTCHPGSDGILAFLKPDYSGGCLFITGNIPDLTPLNFDTAIVSIQFVGSYQNTRQLVIYRQPGYKDECGAYWQGQSDLLQCARLALSVQVLPFTPPTPIPTISGTHLAGNVAPHAMLSPGGAHAVVDGDVQTEWVSGHMVELDLRWSILVTIHRVVVWDRTQSQSDNNQINALRLSFSDGTSTGSIDLVSQGPRCADVTFPEKMVSWLH